MSKVDPVGRLRDDIHSLSHKLTAFDIRNRSNDDWNRFYAATDSLLDVGIALAQFSIIERCPTILERYGFLQALVIQQQAVEELSTAVGLKWKARDNDSLRQVRELRDRIAGHPTWSEKKKAWNYERSSAMQDLSNGSFDEFQVVLYYPDYSKTLRVSYSDLLRKNELALSEQLEEIRNRMRVIEDDFIAASSTSDIVRNPRC